ncbi:hypothetical protein [Alkalihalobacterium chitinilyticum]|uniref:Cytochrome b/b6 N-terminal region profile domain-containing protein n=1 Tax=Alkalihalobacterium chitinilyticum TaxID=2980103 RepID=A0ABT5VG23_9BACI|nr:hypothetical protein [Alkalihalobacterium chitinilyticum]MDE5414396.1 hypothetical protein [Alkalihalobacterium chitinilyticum]
MKLLVQSIIISLVIHAFYFIGQIVYGLMLTNSYVPDIVDSYESVAYLQNEVTFGYIISPIFLFVSFIIVTCLAALAIQLIKKWRGGREL